MSVNSGGNENNDGNDRNDGNRSEHRSSGRRGIDQVKDDIRRLLGEQFIPGEIVSSRRGQALPPKNGHPVLSRTAIVARPRSAGQIRPMSTAKQVSNSFRIPLNLRTNDAKVILIDKINEIALWERQIRLELEVMFELHEKDMIRKKEAIEMAKKRLDEKDKVIRTELSARENLLALNEEHVREKLDSATVREQQLTTNEGKFEAKLKRRVKEKTKDEVAKLREKYYELDAIKRLLNDREVKVSKREQIAKRLTVKLEELSNEMYSTKKQIDFLKDENSSLKSRLDSAADYETVKSNNILLKQELDHLKNEVRSKKDDLMDTKIMHESEKKGIERQLRSKYGEEKRNQEEEILRLKQNFQGKLNKWEDKYEELLKQFERKEVASNQVLAQNQILTKEVNELQSRIASQTSSKSPIKSPSSCCNLCDHHGQESLRISSMDLVTTAKQAVDELRRESRLIEERNKLNLQLLTAAPLASSSSQIATGNGSANSRSNIALDLKPRNGNFSRANNGNGSSSGQSGITSAPPNKSQAAYNVQKVVDVQRNDGNGEREYTDW